MSNNLSHSVTIGTVRVTRTENMVRVRNIHSAESSAVLSTVYCATEREAVTLFYSEVANEAERLASTAQRMSAISQAAAEVVPA